jgi:ribonuclease R
VSVELPRRFVAEVARDGTRWVICGLFSEDRVELDDPPAPDGAIVRVTQPTKGSIGDGRAPALDLEVVALPGSARATMLRLLASHRLDPEHPVDVLAEVHALLHSPGIDDPALADQTARAFVTVDGEGTRDLDQALHVEAHGEGFVVRYAIADASWFVRPGSALFSEALRRGASYYLPGLSAPMLPRELSEGLVSLNPGVDRRAIVFEMHVDFEGELKRTEIVRARVHSRAQLTFDRVQALLDGHDGHGIHDADITESLLALREVGERLIARAAARGVVSHRNAEIRVEVRGENGMDFVVIAEPRNGVERYGEQLSLMCNVAGARVLRRASTSPGVQAIYRTHDAPDAERLDELHAMFEAVARARSLPREFAWDRKRSSLAHFLRQLPHEGPHAAVARAFARQAIMVNVRSSFSAEPGPHFGIGADVYARFSAPMREVVGVFVHKEMLECLAGAAPRGDEATRAAVIEQANRARELQRELTREANLLVLDRIFTAELGQPLESRPVHEGTVMGLRRGKIYVQLDSPPVDVKVYAAELDPTAELEDSGATLRGDTLTCTLGDRVKLRLRERDRAGHWLFDVADPVMPARRAPPVLERP